MSKALKCNRCQRCFDPFEQGTLPMAKFSNPILQTSEERRLNRIGRVLFKDEGIGEFIDLCPDCTEFFIAFMEGCRPIRKRKENAMNGSIKVQNG